MVKDSTLQRTTTCLPSERWVDVYTILSFDANYLKCMMSVNCTIMSWRSIKDGILQRTTVCSPSERRVNIYTALSFDAICFTYPTLVLYVLVGNPCEKAIAWHNSRYMLTKDRKLIYIMLRISKRPPVFVSWLAVVYSFGCDWCIICCTIASE
jgi:hypothetical protein